jgi:plastocyanin
VAGAVVLTASALFLTGVLPAASSTVEVTIATGPGASMVFSPSVVAVPADATIRVAFENVSSEAHNLTFQAPISVATRTIVEPGEGDAVTFRTPGPGAYTFVCTIHIDMTGSLQVR